MQSIQNKTEIKYYTCYGWSLFGGCWDCLEQDWWRVRIGHERTEADRLCTLHQVLFPMPEAECAPGLIPLFNLYYTSSLPTGEAYRKFMDALRAEGNDRHGLYIYIAEG